MTVYTRSVSVTDVGPCYAPGLTAETLDVVFADGDTSVTQTVSSTAVRTASTFAWCMVDSTTSKNPEEAAAEGFRLFFGTIVDSTSYQITAQTDGPTSGTFRVRVTVINGGLEQMSVKVEDATSLGTGFASVLNNSVQATGPQVADTAGFQMLGSEVNAAGAGVGRVVKEIEASEDYRVRVGGDVILFDEKFLGTALSSFAWLQSVTTQTVSVASGVLTLNASAITTLSTVSRVTSQQCFQPSSSSPLYAEWEYLYPPSAPIANSEFEMGLVLHTGTATPTDGAFFRYTTAGTFLAVINYNGTEVTSSALTAPTTNVRHKCVVSVYDDSANFWIDDVLVASIPTPTGKGTIFSAGALPLSFRLRNASSAPASAVSPQIFAASVQRGDLVNSRTAQETAILGGGMACQAQSGATQGTLTNWANSAAPASATLSNTAGGYGTSVLGGQWQFAAVAGAETDYALFAFQVPAAAALAHGKKLVITGVNIDTINTVVAVATTATVLQWGLGFGSTAVSLASAEAVISKGPRRVPVGIQTFPVGAAVGAAAVPINVQGGILGVAMPGEFVHVILKMPIATATATEIFRGTVALWGYWE